MDPQRERKSPLVRHIKIRNSKYNIPKKKRGLVPTGTVKSNTAMMEAEVGFMIILT